MILPFDDLEEMRQFPISLIIIPIIINGIYNHWIYKSIVIFLFEKGLTNRQRREWRKERYFKRKNYALYKSDDKESSQSKIQFQYREVSSCRCGFNCYFYNNSCDSEHDLLFHKRN